MELPLEMIKIDQILIICSSPKVTFCFDFFISNFQKMGNKQASFSAEQIEQYQDCTFFTKKEIMRLHSRFREIAPETIPMNMQSEQERDII